MMGNQSKFSDESWKKGRRGEWDFITRFYTSVTDFADIGDRRDECREGEFPWMDEFENERFAEVKADYRAWKTKNIPIEIYNTANGDGKGWFTHCQYGGVTELVFIFYKPIDTEEGKREWIPWRVISFDFKALVPFVEQKLQAGARLVTAYDDEDKSELLCIPVKEVKPYIRKFIMPIESNDGEVVMLDIPAWLMNRIKEGVPEGLVIRWSEGNGERVMEPNMSEEDESGEEQLILRVRIDLFQPKDDIGKDDSDDGTDE